MSAALRHILARDGSFGPRPLHDFIAGINELYRRLLGLPAQASTYARSLDHLHYFEITVMFGVAGLIAVSALYFSLKYRRRSALERTPRIEAPRWFDISLGVALLAFFTVLWVIGFRQYTSMYRPPAGALDVYVEAKQWMWKFSYPEGRGSVGVLYVPAGRPIRLVLTSRDVIHSFFVPAFRMKRDAVPGIYTTAWFEAPTPGRYPILCAELCGSGHASMWGTVAVLPPEEFSDWLRGRAPAVQAGAVRGGGFPPAEPVFEKQHALPALGREVAARHGCLNCHTLDGRPHIGPTWLGAYGSTVTMQDGERVRVDEAYLTESMMDPGAKIVAGFQPLMPSYLGQMTPAETAAVVELIKSLAGKAAPAPGDTAAAGGAP